MSLFLQPSASTVHEPHPPGPGSGAAQHGVTCRQSMCWGRKRRTACGHGLEDTGPAVRAASLKAASGLSRGEMKSPPTARGRQHSSLTIVLLGPQQAEQLGLRTQSRGRKALLPSLPALQCWPLRVRISFSKRPADKEGRKVWHLGYQRPSASG